MQSQEIALVPPMAAADVRSAGLSRRWFMVLSLAVLNVLDVWTTHLVLVNGGAERNPIMEPVVDVLWHGAAVKVLCLLVVGLLLTRCPIQSRTVERTLDAVALWYLVVVLWNVTVIARLV